MGMCNDAIDYPAVYARFDEEREAILALPRSVPEISEGNQQTAVRYLETFYEIIDSDAAARRQIQDACRR